MVKILGNKASFMAAPEFLQGMEKHLLPEHYVLIGY
jgi:hypothetical protein